MGGPVQLSRRDCRIAPGLRSSCNPTILQPMGQIELRLDCKTAMHRKDCTKILGNPHSKSGSGRHPGNPHRNHDSTPQSQCNPVSIRRLCQDGNSDRNRHNQIEFQQDCKTAKDCQWIKGIAQNSWEIHKLQAIVPNCPRTGLPSQCWHNLLQSR